MSSYLSIILPLVLIINIGLIAMILFSRKFFRRNEKRNIPPVHVTLVIVLLICNILFVYSTLIEPASVEVNNYSVNLFNGTHNQVKLKIAMVADFHVSSQHDIDFLKEVITRLNEIDADYIVIGGDLIDHTEDEIPLLTPLLDIKDRNHTIIVLGNHDYGAGWSNVPLANKLAEWLESNGFTVLRNENFAFQINDSRFCFVGVDSLWSNQIDLDKAYNNLDSDCKTILLSHNPDVIFLLDDERVDLMLSGHTHGGQVCLPFIKPPWIPSKIKERCGRGFYEINDRTLFITKGVVGQIRFNAKPEIAVINVN